MAENLHGRKTKQFKEKDKDLPKDNLGEAFERDVRPYIEVIDNLRKHGLQNDIRLPNVVVVGDQSSGKSSIIEAISGIQLPRGKGIVTRCPLELQLKRMIDNVKWKATLSFKNMEIPINHPQDVENLIIRAQNEICGTKKDISEELLTLRIESNAKNAPELTLIDLPGIARTVMEGQNDDVCIKIKRIIEKFVKNENTVILCMVSANLDVAVNESLNVAKAYDPKSERTLGVITKPDLAEDHQKEEMLRLLNNETFKLKKGYRMVKCRNHDELENQLSLNDALVAEKEFFKNDRFYRMADLSLLGTMNLANKITEELVEVIKRTIPKLKDDIKIALEGAKRELDKLPSGLPNTDAEKHMYLTSIFYEMIKEMANLLNKGTYLKETEEENSFLKWRVQFAEFQNEIIKIQENSFLNEFSLQRLSSKLTETRGREICCFLNYELFEKLSAEHVQKYNPKAQVLLNNMKSLTEEALMDIVNRFLNHIPLVRKDIQAIVAQNMEKFAFSAEQNLKFIFDEEKIVFAMDTVFQREMRELQINFNSKLQFNSQMLQNVLKCYLEIVLNRLCDTIPMTIRQWIHIKLNNALKDSILKYSADSRYEGKMSEDNHLKKKRQGLFEKIHRLELAKRQLYQF